MKDPLAGCSILIVEDDPLIATGLSMTLEQAGAKAIIAARLRDALHWLGSEAIAVAIVDREFDHDQRAKLAEQLQARSIPIANYYGFGHVRDTDPASQLAGPHLSLIQIIANLLRPPQSR